MQEKNKEFDVEKLNEEILEVLSEEKIKMDELLAGRCPAL